MASMTTTAGDLPTTPVVLGKFVPGKRPPNGPNLSGRKSNLKSQNNKWKAQLVQGNVEKERMNKVKKKQDSTSEFKKAQKEKFKQEAAKLDVELGFAEEGKQETNTDDDGEIPEWKKQKMFLNQCFPDKVVCRVYKGYRVFKNKKSMQEYKKKVVVQNEWDANVILLSQMRKAYDDAIEQEKIEKIEKMKLEQMNENVIEEGVEPDEEKCRVELDKEIQVEEQPEVSKQSNSDDKEKEGNIIDAMEKSSLN